MTCPPYTVIIRLTDGTVRGLELWAFDAADWVCFECGQVTDGTDPEPCGHETGCCVARVRKAAALGPGCGGSVMRDGN